MQQPPLPSLCVTGASSGIGLAIVDYMAARGWRVFAGIRTTEDAARLQAINPDYIIPLQMDVTNEDAIQAAASVIDQHLAGQTLKGLVNNAGIAVWGPMRYLSIDKLNQQMAVNIDGLVRVTQALLPALNVDGDRDGGTGRVINMSSVSGRIALPFLAPYAMSKFALEALTDSWRRELLKSGVDMINIGPGAIKTPIWTKASTADLQPFENTEYAGDLKNLPQFFQRVEDQGLPPSAVAKCVYTALTSKKPKARYSVLRAPLLNWHLPQILPKRLLDRIIARRLKLH